MCTLKKYSGASAPLNNCCIVILRNVALKMNLREIAPLQAPYSNHTGYTLYVQGISELSEIFQQIYIENCRLVQFRNIYVQQLRRLFVFQLIFLFYLQVLVPLEFHSLTLFLISTIKINNSKNYKIPSQQIIIIRAIIGIINVRIKKKKAKTVRKNCCTDGGLFSGFEPFRQHSYDSTYFGQKSGRMKLRFD